MKIIFIVSSKNLKYGAGMNRALYNSLLELNQKFDKILILTGSTKLEVLKGILKLLINKPFSFQFMIFNSLSSIRKDHNPNWVVFSFLAKFFMIKKCIYWHEMPEYYNNFKKNPKFSNIAFHINNKLQNKNWIHLNVSKLNSQIANIFEKDPISYIVNNCIIPKPYFSSFLLSNFVVTNTGTIQHIKGTDIWTDVAIKVCKLNSNIIFVWCGSINDKNLYENCLKKIVNEGFTDRILFLGHVEDASIIVSASHLFFSSSRLDSFPLSVLEAMSYGKNIVHYNSGGVVEQLGGYGLFVDYFDVDCTVSIILNQYQLFIGDSKSIFNEDIYNRYYSNYTPEIFVERFKMILENLV